MPDWEQSVYSSMVSSIGYDAEAQTMIVQWANGKTGVYAGVPEDVAKEAANAASVGSYINEVIKGNYSYRNVG